MRVLICLDCESAIVTKEQESTESCSCGKCGLSYFDKKYSYYGENTLVIGFNEESLYKAVRVAATSEGNVNFEAYVTKDTDPKFVKIKIT